MALSHVKYARGKFALYRALKRHVELVHYKVRPHICETCSKGFFDKSTLDRHVKAVHVNEKIFPCTKCKRAFNCVSNLNKHNRSVHLKEKSHVCGVCSKAFFNIKDMKRHKGTVHKNVNSLSKRATVKQERHDSTVEICSDEISNTTDNDLSERLVIKSQPNNHISSEKKLVVNKKITCKDSSDIGLSKSIDDDQNKSVSLIGEKKHLVPVKSKKFFTRMYCV